MDAVARALEGARELHGAAGEALAGARVWALCPDDAPRFEALLSGEERARAARFRFELDRRRHVLGVGATRAALGAALGVDPRALRVERGVHGKPALADTLGVHFNVSHSGAFVLLALSRHGAVGVDVEAHRELDPAELAREVFTERERAALAAISADPARARASFFRTWARKEAALKAWGTGLSLAAARVEVGLDDARARLVRAPEEGLGAVTVVDLALDDAHAAAVAWLEAG